MTETPIKVFCDSRRCLWGVYRFVITKTKWSPALAAPTVGPGPVGVLCFSPVKFIADMLSCSEKGRKRLYQLYRPSEQRFGCMKNIRLKSCRTFSDKWKRIILSYSGASVLICVFNFSFSENHRLSMKLRLDVSVILEMTCWKPKSSYSCRYLMSSSLWRHWIWLRHLLQALEEKSSHVPVLKRSIWK